MISIIIPTYNEADNIANLIHHLKRCGNRRVSEIIVSDAESTDGTIQIAKDAGAKAILSPKKGRAAQMNYGALRSTEDILYFVHADTFPPLTFAEDIMLAVGSGYSFGRYRTRFDINKWILKVNAFFTRFDLFVCYGGDQTLFMTRDLFKSINGFNETMRIMEDYDIVTRAKEKARYKILQKDALVSARKYETNTWFKVQKANYSIVQMYKRGASQDEMVNSYKKMLDYR